MSLETFIEAQAISKNPLRFLQTHTELFCIKNKIGVWVKIDNEDIEKVCNFSWHIDKRTEKYSIVVCHNNNKSLLLHRLVIGAKPGQTIDHINGNPLDNRKSNLRFCTHAQNMQNRVSLIGQKYKGIYFCKTRNNWVAQISINNKTKNIGRFETDKQAALAYNEYAKKYHGKFAKLNEVF